MAQVSGLTRGDRNRNRRVVALRRVVARDRAVMAIDLGEDKQVAVVVDHEGRVLARKVVKAKACQLGGLVEWAAGKAAAAGFAGLTVACEPTGHRWKALMGVADAGGHGFCCVQSLAVARAREGDDYTRDKTDLLTELPRVAAGQRAADRALSPLSRCAATSSQLVRGLTSASLRPKADMRCGTGRSPSPRRCFADARQLLR